MTETGETMRLQRYLAEAGVASRRASEELIRQGRVTVNGETAQIGCTVTGEEEIALDGRAVKKQAQTVVILFYKPRGVVCTAEDPQGRSTVQDYFKEVPVRLFNVGRLDLNSEGLLLMTNDGDLAYRLTHPKYEVEKSYYTVCNGTVTEEEAERLRRGVPLEDGMTAPAGVDFIRPTVRGDTSMVITIHEGRNRQVRRMVEAIGHKTLRLKRERFGGLSLGQLKSGEWRYLTEREIAALHEKIGL